MQHPDKKVLLILIDSLKRGGAEVLIVNILQDLNKRFNVVLVTLYDSTPDFSDEALKCYKRYTLGYSNKFSAVKCIFALRRIIRQHQPSLVHSHLFYSSLIARIATPVSIPLLYSIHTEMSRDIFNQSKLSKVVERNTVFTNQAVVAVSDSVLADYQNLFGTAIPSYVLKNFISDDFFRSVTPKHFISGNPLKLVAVANIKKTKNYGFLLKAFSYLKDIDVSLDIYGTGTSAEVAALQTEIDDGALQVRLRGSSAEIQNILPSYDMYVSSSEFEGFGLSVVEAMAAALPVLLSDLAVFREVTAGNALFFGLSDPAQFANLVREVYKGMHETAGLSTRGIDIARQYNKGVYLVKLFNIYDDVITNGTGKQLAR